MTLPPKALSVLIDIKRELLAQSVTLLPVPPVPDKANVMITRKHSHVMRHARDRGRAVQRMYQRGEL
jgi:hypothetical protein